MGTECNHELKPLTYCCDDDYGIHTSWVKGQDGNMVLKYCVKCGAVFAVKEGWQDERLHQAFRRAGPIHI